MLLLYYNFTKKQCKIIFSFFIKTKPRIHIDVTLNQHIGAFLKIIFSGIN